VNSDDVDVDGSPIPLAVVNAISTSPAAGAAVFQPVVADNDTNPFA